MHISPAQCRAARALLDWPRERLAEASGIHLRTIVDFENGTRLARSSTLSALTGALEAAGVTLLRDNGQGEGLRMKARQ